MPTVLIVDDEHANQFLLDGLLSANGYQTRVAGNGEECLKLVAENPPDLILLDIMMPKMTGIEVLEELLKNDQHKQIPVIMVSAKTGISDIEQALLMGAIDYVKKPFNETELLARVKVGIRLKENEDHLREIIQQKENFVRIIAHDLRSPFAAIHGFAEILLSDDNLNDDQKESINMIIESIGYSQDYFNKLLSWTQLDQNNIPLNKSETNLSKLVSGIFQIFDKKALDKGIQLVNQVDEQIRLDIDGTYFRQAIANLVNNAVKFTPAGGSITCKTAMSGDFPELIVSDTGIGIPVEITYDQLFNSSIAPSRKGTNGEKGTGLGLGICKKILEAHGFGITFTSVLNKGTNFMIRLHA